MSLLSEQIPSPVPPVFLLLSEQTPSSVALGVLMNRENTVRQAGGFIIQLLPGAEEATIAALEKTIGELEPQELLLRIYAVLRRTYKEDSPLLVLDGCTIDFSRAEVHKGSEVISLTAKEHTLLETLARNAGKIVTVDTLCEALWGDNPFGYENSLNAHVRRVREKIETDPSKPVSLITIKGLGYKLISRK